MNYKILLWETNQNGNWDIAYYIGSGMGWGENKLLLDSPEDELDPSFNFLDWSSYYYINQLQIVFSRGSSVFLFSRDSIDNEKLLFAGNDTVKYSDPVMCSYDKLYVVAVRNKKQLSSGIYFYRLSAGYYIQTKKKIYLK